MSGCPVKTHNPICGRVAAESGGGGNPCVSREIAALSVFFKFPRKRMGRTVAAMRRATDDLPPYVRVIRPAIKGAYTAPCGAGAGGAPGDPGGGTGTMAPRKQLATVAARKMSWPRLLRGYRDIDAGDGDDDDWEGEGKCMDLAYTAAWDESVPVFGVLGRYVAHAPTAAVGGGGSGTSGAPAPADSGTTLHRLAQLMTEYGHGLEP